jgi:holdfast attachment protein HfaA
MGYLVIGCDRIKRGSRQNRWHERCFIASDTNFPALEGRRLRKLALLTAACIAYAGAAAADPLGDSGDFGRAFAMDGDSFDNPINPQTRDANGNRTIVNGRMEIEGTLSGGLMDGYDSGSSSSAQAVGNQLNVVTQGNYNTVIVNSNQINNGDVSADVHGGH